MMFPVRMFGSFLVIILTFHAQTGCPAVIQLPEDAPSIQEAVEMASSGDVIQVNRHDVYFVKDQSAPEIREGVGIRIVDKDLTITGTLPGERARIIQYENNGFIVPTFRGMELPPSHTANLLVIENSNVVIENLAMNAVQRIHYPPFGDPDGFTAAPVQVVSGKLTMNNVEFTGIVKAFSALEIIDSTIYGYSYYNRQIRAEAYPIPAIHIRNQDSPNINIIHTTIKCDVFRDDVNFGLDITGSRPIVIEKTSNANMRIVQSAITAGYHLPGLGNGENPPESYWNFADPNKGLAGILIVDCANLVLDLDESSATGGFGPNFYRFSISSAIPSGPGIEVLNSNHVTIRNGESRGKDGVSGGLDLDKRKYQATDGGNGLHVLNSTVTLENVSLVPGRRGDGDAANDIPPGRDGLPVYRDERSVVRFESNVLDWDLFR